MQINRIPVVNMPQLSEHDKAILNSVFNPNLPLTEAYNEELHPDLKDVEEDTPEIRQAKELEVEAIRKAEAGDYSASLDVLRRTIELAPGKASLYNNRAQVHQLNGRVSEALEDLTKAIELGREGQVRTTCQAFCQRGLIHRKAGKDELARDDFNEAAKLGSQFAKNQLVELNPYAALCNQMLQQVFENLK